jgi:hypothetical protein
MLTQQFFHTTGTNSMSVTRTSWIVRQLDRAIAPPFQNQAITVRPPLSIRREKLPDRYINEDGALSRVAESRMEFQHSRIPRRYYHPHKS